MGPERNYAHLLRLLGSFQSVAPSSLKPVFWLGAGCSVFDRVPLNAELLRSEATLSTEWGSDQFRFDVFYESLGIGISRASLLRRYFERQLRTQSPLRKMCKLLTEGYSDIIFTFNIDDLLEQAMKHDGLQEGVHYRLVKVPEIRSDAVLAAVNNPNGPRICIVKLHGNYDLGFNCLTSKEITTYEEPIRRLVEEYSRRAAVVCGYSFFHLNVLRSFCTDGGPLFFVNKVFPEAAMVLSLLWARSSTSPLVIDGSLGEFSSFMSNLSVDLLGSS